MKFGVFLSFLLFASAIHYSYGQNYVFAQLTGTPMNTTGWNMQGDAHVGNIVGTADSEMVICSLSAMIQPSYLNMNPGSSGAVFYNQPINLSLCHKWIAEFDFRMYDGTGADGIAFCFLNVPPTGFVIGGGLGVPSTANGLKVCFDTWNNCIPFDPATVHEYMPKIELRWGPGYSECPNYEPTKDNRDGDISFIRSVDYQHAKITYDTGAVNVYVNDKLYLTGYQTFDFTGYLGFTASTGGYNDNHSIKNVIIYTEMPPSFAGNSKSICPYDTVQIGGPDDPNYVYSWTPAEGLSDPTLSAPLLHVKGDSVDDRLLNYHVHTAFKNNPGCASIDSVQIKVYPNPNVHFIVPKICLTDAVAQFQDSTITGDSATLPFSYQWNFGDPNAGALNPNSSAAANPSHNYSAASNYPLKLVVTNSMGCRDSLTKTFTVNGAVPLASFRIPHASALCTGQSVDILNESSVDFGSITKVQIYWGDSSTVSYTDNDPYTGKLYSHFYPNPVSTNIPGYKIRMISFSGIKCENESDQQITLEPSPHIQFNAIPSICSYDPAFAITQASELTQLPGSFSFSGEGISSAGLFDPKISGAGVFSMLCQYTSTDGCIDSARQTITVIQPPKVFAGNDTSVVVSQPLQLQALADQTGDSFQWTPVTGLDDPDISNPVSLLGSDIESVKYMVKATDTSGCFGEAAIVVKVFKTAPNIFVPNAFTPGSSMNNIFRPIPVGISSIQFFRIYNRWGQLVYSKSGMGTGWDGTISGKPQQTGSYVWMVQGTTYTGTTIFKQGTMVLIR
jgi:gliding motility-associated-like protein